MKLIYVDSYEFSNLRALCLRRITKHICTCHPVFWKSSLEDIRGNPSAWPLTPLNLPTVPLHLWSWATRQLICFSPPAARRLWSHPWFRRSWGPLPSLRRWREQLCVCGGSVQRLAAGRRSAFKHFLFNSFIYFSKLLPQMFVHVWTEDVDVIISGGEKEFTFWLQFANISSRRCLQLNTKRRYAA